MLQSPLTTQCRQRRASVAAAAILVIAASSAGFDTLAAGKPHDEIAKRSLQRLGPTQEFDRRALRAFQSKSVDEMRRLYVDLHSTNRKFERHLDQGKNACGCDVATTTLLIIIGFALNKLDGLGRYQPWMQGESVELVKTFQGHLTDCAFEAGQATINLQLEPDHVKAL